MFMDVVNKGFGSIPEHKTEELVLGKSIGS